MSTDKLNLPEWIVGLSDELKRRQFNDAMEILDDAILSGDTAALQAALLTILTTNGDILQNVGGSVVRRTVAQLLVSLVAAGAVDLTTAQTLTKQKTISISAAATLPLTLINAANTNPYGLEVYFSGQSGSSGGYYLVGVDNGGNRILIADTGNVTNTNNSYGAISDRKLKTDITLAGSQWDDVKAIAAIVSKYRLKDDPTQLVQIGLIADDLGEISPGLIETHADTKREDDGTITALETTTATVKYSVLNVKALKALGEALERIESLEMRVSALESEAP